jgi:hypothetical protein
MLIPNWLAFTLGNRILAWRQLGDDELEHELEHVRQWRRHGVFLPILYLLASWRARRAGGSWYRDNHFEVEARAAAQRVANRLR